MKGTVSDQVLLDDGSLSSDKSTVFHKWVNHFKGLYNREVDNNNDIEYKNIQTELAIMEQFHCSNDNNILNCVITVPEVYDMIKN